jgi:hypothetical protein
MPLKRIWIPSPNYSSRGGANVRLVVIHTAEGALTIESLGSWFANPNAQCSSQVGTDDTPNTVGEYVSRANKSWTQSEFNPVATSNELCGFASWSTAEWDRHPNMLDNCAKWIAEECDHFGIPIVRLSAAEAQGSGRGVCQHVDLGSRGGGHWDCGSGFPMDRVLEMARGGAAPTPPDTPEPITEDDMITAVVKQNGAIEVFVEKTDGRVYHSWQQGGEGGKWYSTDGGKSIGWQSMGEPGGK